MAQIMVHMRTHKKILGIIIKQKNKTAPLIFLATP